MYLEVVALYHEALVHGYHLQHSKHSSRGASSSSISQGKSPSSSGGEAATADLGKLDMASSDVQEQGQQQAAGFGPYLGTLPHTIRLPVFLEGTGISSNSQHTSKPSNGTDDLCQQLLHTLPHINRLTLKRITGLKEAWRIVKPLLTALSKPAAETLLQLKPCEQFQGFQWAYGMAKTRVVTLEVEAVPGVMGQKLQELGIEDVGVMVPLLDMANHASRQQVGCVEW